jgi:1-phosphofructokinase/tagatose 6-phosphate kinase
VEEGNMAGEGTENRLLEALDSLLPESTSMIIGGTKAKGFCETIIPEMVRRAKNAGLFVILDTRGNDLINSLPYKPDLIKPNLDEFIATFAPGTMNEKTPCKEMIVSLCSGIWKQYGCRIVLTRGNQSVWYFDDGAFGEFSVEPVEAVNTTGSGDAFTAGLASALSDGASLREALAEGARCGHLNALSLKPGSILPDPESLALSPYILILCQL